MTESEMVYFVSGLLIGAGSALLVLGRVIRWKVASLRKAVPKLGLARASVGGAVDRYESDRS